MDQYRREILETVAATGKVHPDRFIRRGYLVSSLVRNGLLEWERANPNGSTKATGLLITPEGRKELARSVGMQPRQAEAEGGSVGPALTNGDL